MSEARQAAIQNIFDSARAQVSELILAASRETAGALNAAVRALAAAPDATVWRDSLLDAVARIVTPVLLLRRDGSQLVVQGGRGLEPPVRVAGGAAIAQAIESGETAVAAAAAGEISPELAALDWRSRRVYLFPVAGPVSAVLLTGMPFDVAAVELLVSVATLSLERLRRNANPLVAIDAKPAAASWERLPRDLRERHLQAQRFARVKVAEWQMSQAATIAAGRASRSLYNAIRPHVDAAREQFRQRFTDNSQLPDYLHLEIVRTLAGDDESILGEDYPGPLA